MKGEKNRMKGEKKERIEGKCPICSSPCFLSETKSGNEYSYFCKTGKHRGFIAREEDIATLFQIKEVKDETGTEGRERLYRLIHRAAPGETQGGSRLRERIERNRSSSQRESRLR
jgi:hypothetical protein